MQSALEAQTQLMTDNLEDLAASDPSKFANFITAVKELKDNITNLYKKAKAGMAFAEAVYKRGLDIARLTMRIMKMPSDLAVSLSEKIQGYTKLTTDLINQYKNDPFGIEKIKKAYAGAKLGLTSAVASIASGSALTVSKVASSSGTASKKSSTSSSSSTSAGKSGTDKNAGTSSRKEAIEAANKVLALMEQITAFSDTKIEQDAFVDSDSTSFLALSELVQNSVQLILNASFALPMQRTITLDRDRNVIELCAELYGSVDSDIIDQFIMENNLSIDEIQLLTMGREVSYYVQVA
jgi:hypothetical protein